MNYSFDQLPFPKGESNIRLIDTKTGSSLDIDSYGSVIRSLRLNDVKVLGYFQRGDESWAGSHPCFPFFGPDVLGYGLSRHGPGRTSDWSMVNSGLIDTQSVSLDVKGGTYPDGLYSTRTFKLERGIFSLRTKNENKGSANLPVNSAEHFYFSTGYAGWEDVSLDSLRLSPYIKTTQDVDLTKKNVLTIPGHAELLIEQTGYEKAFCWVGTTPATGELDNHYFCFEPVEHSIESFGKTISILKPGESRETEVKISVLANLKP